MRRRPPVSGLGDHSRRVETVVALPERLRDLNPRRAIKSVPEWGDRFSKGTFAPWNENHIRVGGQDPRIGRIGPPNRDVPRDGLDGLQVRARFKTLAVDLRSNANDSE